MEFYLPKIIINPHCHGRDMLQKNKATIFKVLLESLRAGIGITFFMPNTQPPIITEGVLIRVLRLIKEAKKDLGIALPQFVWFGVTDGNLEECEKALKYTEVIGLKIYPKSVSGKSVTTGAIGVAQDETILGTMRLGKKTGKAVAFHPEDPDIVLSEGHTIRAEVEYIKKIIRLAKQVPGVKIVVCHVSCKESFQLIVQAQREGMNIAIELTPHHLWFDDSGTMWNENLASYFYKCYPPLRGHDDREYLVWQLSSPNPQIFIGSDHAPHSRVDKEKGAAGIPNLYEMVPTLLTFAIENKISPIKIAELLSFNAANFFGIKAPRKLVKHTIEARKDAFKYSCGVVNPWEGSELYWL